MAYGSVSVGNTATLIVADNPQRIGLIVSNNGSATLFIGPDSSVTASSGIPILSDSNLTEDNGGTKMYCAAVWGITSSGTADVRYWERTR